MTESRARMTVAVVSGSVGKSPDYVKHSFVFDEVYRLASRGVEVHVVRPDFESTSVSYGIHYHGLARRTDGNAVRSMFANASCYPPTALLRNPGRLYWENLWAANVSAVVERDSCQVIHAHFAYPEGLVGLLAKRQTGRQLVVTAHGYDILSEPSIGYGSRLNKQLDAITCRVLDRADAVVTASKASYFEVSKIVTHPNRIHLIPNGVDLKRFHPSLNGHQVKSRLGFGDRHVIFSLRVHEPKNGLEHLIRAIPLVVKEKRDVVFVIGGDGSLREYHEELATRLNVRGNVVFTGWLPHDTVPLFYAMSDVVVVPSIQEAFGLAVTEAMACGKPVIGSNVGGITDQIDDGYNGFKVQPGDPQIIAQKVLWLLEHANEARRMGSNGRRIAESKFDIDARINSVMSLYERLPWK